MRRALILAAIALGVRHVALRAQAVGATSLFVLGSDSEERLRLAQLLGNAPSSGFLIRSAARLTNLDTSGAGVGLVLPDVYTVHNSELPFSLNDGALWAGRGWNASVTAGVYVRQGPVRVILAPTVAAGENLPFQVIPYAGIDRSRWANPFHPLPESIDLPLRFGDHPRRDVGLGQSSVTIDAGAVAFGVASENLWWGPGIQNALALSNNAAGFLHAFVQTRRPLRTRIGTFDSQAILGRLDESLFFDFDPANDHRSLSGLVMTWSPDTDETLTVGAGRLVMAAHANGPVPVSAALNVFRTVGHANADTSAEPTGPNMDQIFSVFARWVFPEAGFEAYGELARFEEPLSFRDLLEFPGHSEGYTLGFQWAHPFAIDRTFRLQGEVSYLEPDPSLRVRPVGTTYTSHGVPQGFTQHGETLGAAIGPGSSSQRLGGDYFARTWRLGAYLNRIRWDNAALFEPIVPFFRRQDVTLSAGMRCGLSWHGVNLLIDFGHATRFNYLFQSYILDDFKFGGIDLVNNTLAVSLSTTLGRR